jgi:hypothetical protein
LIFAEPGVAEIISHNKEVQQQMNIKVFTTLPQVWKGPLFPADEETKNVSSLN